MSITDFTRRRENDHKIRNKKISHKVEKEGVRKKHNKIELSFLQVN